MLDYFAKKQPTVGLSGAVLAAAALIVISTGLPAQQRNDPIEAAAKIAAASDFHTADELRQAFPDEWRAYLNTKASDPAAALKLRAARWEGAARLVIMRWRAMGRPDENEDVQHNLKSAREE